MHCPHKLKPPEHCFECQHYKCTTLQVIPATPGWKVVWDFEAEMDTEDVPAWALVELEDQEGHISRELVPMVPGDTDATFSADSFMESKQILGVLGPSSTDADMGRFRAEFKKRSEVRAKAKEKQDK